MKYKQVRKALAEGTGMLPGARFMSVLYAEEKTVSIAIPDRWTILDDRQRQYPDARVLQITEPDYIELEEYVHSLRKERMVLTPWGIAYRRECKEHYELEASAINYDLIFNDDETYDHEPDYQRVLLQDLKPTSYETQAINGIVTLAGRLGTAAAEKYKGGDLWTMARGPLWTVGVSGDFFVASTREPK